MLVVDEIMESFNGKKNLIVDILHYIFHNCQITDHLEIKQVLYAVASWPHFCVQRNLISVVLEYMMVGISPVF